MRVDRPFIGVVGGMGPLSSIRFYEEMIRCCHVELGLRKNSDYPHMVLSNLPVPDLIDDESAAEVTQSMIVDELKRLEDLGCSMLAIACNTVHIYFDRFDAATSVPLLNMAEEAVDELARRGASEVLVLGTPTTLRNQLYDDLIHTAGMKATTPSGEEVRWLGGVISRLVGNVHTEVDVRQLETMITSYLQRGVDGILLGCTELGIALPDNESLVWVEPLSVLARRVAQIGTGRVATRINVRSRTGPAGEPFPSGQQNRLL